MTTAAVMNNNNNGKTIKLEMLDGEQSVINDIEEYVCGFSYFYCRLLDGSTVSFNRSDILSVSRKLPGGKFWMIHLKKIKTYENSDDNLQSVVDNNKEDDQ